MITCRVPVAVPRNAIIGQDRLAKMDTCVNMFFPHIPILFPSSIIYVFGKRIDDENYTIAPEEYMFVTSVNAFDKTESGIPKLQTYVAIQNGKPFIIVDIRDFPITDFVFMYPVIEDLFAKDGHLLKNEYKETSDISEIERLAVRDTNFLLVSMQDSQFYQDLKTVLSKKEYSR